MGSVNSLLDFGGFLEPDQGFSSSLAIFDANTH